MEKEISNLELAVWWVVALGTLVAVTVFVVAFVKVSVG